MSAAVGAALVLDAELRVELITKEARDLLGFDVAVGASSLKVLCKRSPKRALSQALADGRAIQVVIPHPLPSANRTLQVRALPLRPAGATTGWLLLLDEAAPQSDEPELFQGMWTQSPRMQEIFRVLERVAADDVTVLVRGESGSGKELVAQALHALSPRRAGPFRAINCAALPANLLESELFGHVRGAFTGAVADTPGHFQLANKGTLFLDEVAEMPLELQAKLLRVLETRSVLAVGARQPSPIDVRIVSATHRALRREVELGHFRADLMYRLRVIPIFLPALRDRKEDIALLCEKLIESMNQTARRRIERVAPSALAVLERHDWPGNVRELRNALQYAYAIGDGPILRPSDLPPELLERTLDTVDVGAGRSATSRLDPEARRIVAVLERNGGNRNKAAKVLGISRVTLWRRLRALGLDVDGSGALARGHSSLEGDA
jgi:transcriptional regulator with PAS, ATPase and Fis domain